MKKLSQSIKTCAMKSEHYEAVYALWARCNGVKLSDKDNKAQILRYLKRNKSLSSVAISNGEIVGALLCGHDGLKGFIHHIAVDESFRRMGIGQNLVARSLKLLAKQEIGVCQIVVSAVNHHGEQFWTELGWKKQDDYLLLTDKPQDRVRSIWQCSLIPVASAAA